jgi:hypothetical protein
MVIYTLASTKVLVHVHYVLSVKRLYEMQPRTPVGYGLQDSVLACDVMGTAAIFRLSKKFYVFT